MKINNDSWEARLVAMVYKRVNRALILESFDEEGLYYLLDNVIPKDVADLFRYRYRDDMAYSDIRTKYHIDKTLAERYYRMLFDNRDYFLYGVEKTESNATELKVEPWFKIEKRTSEIGLELYDGRLRLPQKLYSVLHNAGIYTVEDLINKDNISGIGLFILNGFGPTKAKKLIVWLKRYGITIPNTESWYNNVYSDNEGVIIIEENKACTECKYKKFYEEYFKEAE